MTNIKALRRAKEQQVALQASSVQAGHASDSPHAGSGGTHLVSVDRDSTMPSAGLAKEPDVISPVDQMRERIEASGLLDAHTRDNRANRAIDDARADLEARLVDVLRTYGDGARSRSVNDILAIRSNVREIRKRYIDIALKLYEIQQETPDVYRAITRDPSLIDLTSDSDISKLRTVGEAIRRQKVRIEWLPKSKEAAYEVAKLDDLVIQEGLRTKQIGPDAKVTAIKAWVKSKTAQPIIEAVDTVDAIDVKIGALLKRQEEIEEEAERRINAIKIELHVLKRRRTELLASEERSTG